MLIHTPTQSVLLQVPDPFMIRELLTKSRVIDHADYNIAVKHTLESCKVLRNIGLEIPSPIVTQYDWPGKYKPMQHQYVMAEFMTMHRRAFNLSEMGVGKTASALWAADWLMKTKRVRKALILSPLSTLDRVWKTDIFDVLMHRIASTVYGTLDQRKARLAVNADFYILNHDGVKIKEVAEIIRKRPDIDLIIIDEASAYRNHGIELYKALVKMIRPDVRLWLMTGTPCPNAPTDAWALARLVDENRVPKFFGSFKRQTMLQVSSFKWVPKADAYDIAYQAMQPAVRFKKADCIDLPAVVQEDRQSKLSIEQRAAFETMRKTMVAEAKATTITAVNAADKINKIRQILCGAIKDPESHEYITYDHKPRLDVLLECIQQASAKSLVIIPFKGITQALAKEVAKHYSVGVLNGDVPPRQRDEIITQFKFSPDPHVLLCHPKVMAHGLNLTEADMCIFYAPIYSNDEAQQVVERFNRKGQTRKMTVVRIAAHPIEWEIYKMVDNKKVTQENILNLYQAITE